MSAAPMTDLDLFRRLIGFDTTSCNPTRPIADFVSGFLADAGCEVHEYPYADGAKVNLLARRGPTTDGGLILSGHLDVVPATQDDWESDPFELTDRQDAYFARGSADMKGFVAVAVNLLAGLQDVQLRRPVVLLLTSDEEVGTCGAQEFVKSWDRRFPLPTEAIVGEPTELRLVRMHKGHLVLRLTITGRPAHTGYPHLGASAIEPAADLIAALRDLRRSLDQERTAESVFFRQCPQPVLNTALIRGGSAVNIIPDRCVVEVGVRLLPGQSSAEFLQRFGAHLASVENLPHDRLTWEVVNDSPPMLCPQDSPLHTALTRFLGQTDSYGVSFATDAGPLSGPGGLGIRSVLWGPGRIEDAHQANECIAKDQFIRAGRLLERFVRQRCCP